MGNTKRNEDIAREILNEGSEIKYDIVPAAVTRRLTENNPKKLIARVSALPTGAYTLRVVTRFAGSNTPLKEARTITYNRPVTVL